MKQVEAGMIFLAANEFNEEAFKTACGIGVTYKVEDMKAFLNNFLQENP